MSYPATYTDQQGNVWSIPAPPGSLPSIFNTSSFVSWDDFGSVTQNTSITSSTSVYADHKWSSEQISSGTGIWEEESPGDGTHFGVLKFGSSVATSGYGQSFYFGGGGLSAYVLNPSTQPFVYQTAFSLYQDSSVGYYVGLVSSNNQGVIPSASTAVFTGLRADTNQGDTKYSYVTGAGTSQTITPSTVAIDNSTWHKLMIYSPVAGQIIMQIDNATPVTFNTNIYNGNCDFVQQIVNYGTSAAYAYVDYVGLNIPGLNR